MARFRFGALAFLLLASCAGEAAVPAGPSAEFPDKVQDFGAVLQGRRIEHSYEVRNRGRADLVLAKVEASEALTVQAFDRVVPAGGTGKIRIALDTADIRGVGKLVVRVHTNDPQSPETRLGFHVRVVRPLEVEPRDRFYFFKVQGEGGKERLSLVNHGERPVAVTGIASDDPHFQPSYKPVAPGKRYELTLALDPATPAGRYEGTVTVSTDLAALPEVAVPVRAIVEEVVSARPPRVLFGKLRAEDLARQEISRRQVLVTRHRGEGFEVLGAETELPFLKLEVVPESPGKSHRVFLTIVQETVPKGEFQGTVTIRTNDPAFPRIVLPVRGTIV